MKQSGLLILTLFLTLLVAIPAVWSDSAETTNHAAVVVDYGNGTVDSVCVAFQETQISGYELLSRSGLTLIVDVQGGLGAAVCSIGNVGCPASNCFCDAPRFWRYSYLNNNAWQSYAQGASSSQIGNGDVDGWAWGTDNPTVMTFDQVCSDETTTPVASPSPQPPSNDIFLPSIMK